jgi:hypothetical protein
MSKTLILDIETAPILANVWRTWKENVGLNQIRHDWYILSFSAKWLHQRGRKHVMYFDQSQAANIEDDTGLMQKLWELLDEADFVVAHNGRKFDLKKINARFIIRGFLPPSPYQIIDTLDIAKGNFAFTSNRLAYLTDTLCTEKKLAHAKFPGFDLWKECLAGNPAAWREMKAYNIQDVMSLEELYLKLRAWDTKHPSVTAIDEPAVTACPKCGSHNVIQKGYRHTQVGKYARFCCNDCGGWSRGRTMLNTKDVRSNLLIPS